MKSLTATYETLLLDEPCPGVVVITLNRPARRNAMTNTMFAELEHAAEAFDGEDDCRVVILTGAGTAFCAGYDLADAEDLPGLGVLGMLDQQERAARALLAVRTLRVPVIAAINGAAAGGGLSLALAADIRIASPTAKLNAAFVRIGLSAGDLGTSWLLTRLIGPAHASEICFTGRLVEADEAQALGLRQQRQRSSPATTPSHSPSGSRRTHPAASSSRSGHFRPTWKSPRTPLPSSWRTAARRC